MNDLLRVIKERRTTRKYTAQPVERQAIETIVEAGLYAPSGHNKQPWHFTVITDSAIMDTMNQEVKGLAKQSPDEMIQKMASNDQFHIFYNAPAMIVISGNAEEGVTMREDCAAAAQNMLLAAESLGLGACWNGMVSFLFRSPLGESYQEKFSIPQGYQPLYAVVLGHKAVSASQAPARKQGTVTYL